MESNYKDRIINDALRTRGYYPLRSMQLWIVDSQFYKVKSTMMNLARLWKLSPEVDLNRLAQAVNETLKAYDVFRCRLVFHPETNDICQRFDGELVPVKVEKISDEEFEERKKTLMQPYNIINQPLYRNYIFETPTAKYYFIDFYHAIMDGTSIITLFIGDVNSRYKGKKITRQPLNYADYILEDMKISKEEFDAGSKYWMDNLNKLDIDKHFVTPDLIEFDDNTAEEKPTDWERGYIAVTVKNITEKYFLKSKYKEHIFFFAATMLAIAKSTGSKNALMDFVHNGRYSMQERRLMGPMIEQYPVCCEFEDGMNVQNLFDSIEEKMTTCFKYRKSLGTAYNSGLDIFPTFIFQKKIHSVIRNLNIGGYNSEEIEIPPNEWSASENTLDVEVNLSDEGNYYIEYNYDASLYSESAIEKLAATLDEIVLQLQDEQKLISEIL
ncbi:MAG: hypothetical protein IKZ58_06940 [Selenomonadaceae bacterium]|nr:hypothetical protein [Selenomonadaceae bacterium]